MQAYIHATVLVVQRAANKQQAQVGRDKAQTNMKLNNKCTGTGTAPDCETVQTCGQPRGRHKHSTKEGSINPMIEKKEIAHRYVHDSPAPCHLLPNTNKRSGHGRHTGSSVKSNVGFSSHPLLS